MMFRSMLSVMAAGVLALLALAPPALAQSGQPTQVNPTASSVKEQQLLEALKPAVGTTSAVAGRVTIPDKGSGNLINPAGREFRDYHQSTVPRIGGLAILGMLVLVTLFYFVRGKVRVSGGESGQTIVRFGGLDRFAHWLTALSFLALALTGLNLTFGKSIVLPIVGPENFTALTLLGKLVHNYVSFAFALGILLMFVLWVKDNLPHPRDILWFLQGGGLIGSWHPAAARFNAGQKIIFWLVILGGIGLSVTGYILMFPFQFTDIAGQQLSQILHALIGAVLFAVIIAHVYIGSIGMEGAFRAMGSGRVDLNWAKEHHSIWVERVAQKDPKALSGRATPAE
jgi:formate dehydrogenase subunit gamma